MPNYCYECEACGEFEIKQSIKDLPLEECPNCVNIKFNCDKCEHQWFAAETSIAICPECSSNKVNFTALKPKKLISLSSFILAGGGWAKDRYSK